MVSNPSHLLSEAFMDTTRLKDSPPTLRRLDYKSTATEIKIDATGPYACASTFRQSGVQIAHLRT